MTDPNVPTADKAITRAQTLPLQSLVNTFVRALLHTPLLSRAVGK